jgi:hypothetical protein
MQRKGQAVSFPLGFVVAFAAFIAVVLAFVLLRDARR